MQVSWWHYVSLLTSIPETCDVQIQDNLETLLLLSGYVLINYAIEYNETQELVFRRANVVPAQLDNDGRLEYVKLLGAFLFI